VIFSCQVVGELIRACGVMQDEAFVGASSTPR
jgi:hypothetical protein